MVFIIFACLFGHFSVPWGSKRVLVGPWGALESQGCSSRTRVGSLGVPWGPRALLGDALGASWETLEATLGTLGHPWGVPGAPPGSF